MNQIEKARTIGDRVWRVHGTHFKGEDGKFHQKIDWYEPFFVNRTTRQRVYIDNPITLGEFYLDKANLLSRGRDIKIVYKNDEGHLAYGGEFVLERPEEYAKQTLGYLIQQKPRDILGLSHDASVEDAKKIYYKLALRYHPDSGGDTADPVKFQEISEAYQAIRRGTSLGNILKAVKDIVDEELQHRAGTQESTGEAETVKL